MDACHNETYSAPFHRTRLIEWINVSELHELHPPKRLVQAYTAGTETTFKVPKVYGLPAITYYELRENEERLGEWSPLMKQ